MGSGEDYLDEFGKWFAQRDADEKRGYAEENPEPRGWEGFYSGLA
jgi:hypothetical protein